MRTTRRSGRRSERPTVMILPILLLPVLSACGGGGSEEPPANRPPVAQFSASPADGFAPLTVTFSASGSSDPDGNISSYRWSFGDDTTASGVRVTHTYEEPGSFTARLEVTDDRQLTASATRTLRIRGASVSGTILIPSDSGVDSDVNDRLTTPVSNNSFGQAQPVAPRLKLGGYVNVPGTGSPDGNFRTTGDPEDIFTVDLEGHERIVLAIGEPGADLDLELYTGDGSPELIDASVSPEPGTDATEDLPAPKDPGRYFVRVVAVSGASNYLLSIDEDSSAITAAGRRLAKRLSDPFVPGEILMATAARERVRRYGLEPADDVQRLQALDEPWIRPPDVPIAGPARLPAEAVISPPRALRYRTLLAARQLAAREDLAVAEVNVLRRPLRVPDDPLYDGQWHLRTIELEDAWNLTVGDATPEVVVAVVDSGVLIEHPELKNQLLRDGQGRVVGYDFIRDRERANDGDGPDPDPSDPGDDEFGPGQGSYHGTHVAGIVAAESDNGRGVAGVAWRARIMPLRVLGVEGGTTFDVMQAVRYAAGLSNSSGTIPPVRADVINLSLGSDFHSEAEQQTMNEVRARGIFLVSSAGNTGSSVPSYPAAYEGVISVAATTVLDQAANYSNFGPQIDVAAPGGMSSADADGDGRSDGILSTVGAGRRENIRFDYDFYEGTSMATPHVSGVIALMKAVRPELTPADLQTLLRSGRLTDDAGPPGRDDQFGWGIINAFKAVLAAQQLGDKPLGPSISVSTDSLDFHAFTTSLEFAVSNSGNQPAQVEVTDDADWLTVSPVEVGPDGFGRYRAIADRSGLADGNYTATVTVQTADAPLQTLRVGVVMQVTSPDWDADAGQHYVLLTTPDQQQTVVIETVTAVDGQYRFSLEDVPPGEYRLFAGTDLDDDDLICDGGEACGAFPSLGSPEILQVDPASEPTLEGLDFASEFRTAVQPTAGANRASGVKQQKPLPSRNETNRRDR